jgi:hypothetical protein
MRQRDDVVAKADYRSILNRFIGTGRAISEVAKSLRLQSLIANRPNTFESGTLREGRITMYELVWPDEPLHYITEITAQVLDRTSYQIDAVYGEHLYLIFEEPENQPRHSVVANMGALLQSIFAPD